MQSPAWACGWFLLTLPGSDLGLQLLETAFGRAGAADRFPVGQHVFALLRIKPAQLAVVPAQFQSKHGAVTVQVSPQTRILQSDGRIEVPIAGFMLMGG